MNFYNHGVVSREKRKLCSTKEVSFAAHSIFAARECLILETADRVESGPTRPMVIAVAAHTFNEESSLIGT